MDKSSVYEIRDIGDWSNGMIGVSKTFGGSSILSSPVYDKHPYSIVGTDVFVL